MSLCTFSHDRVSVSANIRRTSAFLIFFRGAPVTDVKIGYATFRPPPLDGSLSLPEVYDWHLENNPNHRLFIFAKDDGSIRTIYWPEAVRAIYTGAKLVRDRMHWTPGMQGSPVVAILAPSDEHHVCELRRVPDLPAQLPTAVAHLIDKAHVKHILVGREQSMGDLANEALEILKRQYPNTAAPELSPMPLFEELFLPDTAPLITKDDVPHEFKGSDATVMILHSSGSTAFPKPIVWTNHRFAQLSLIPWFGERDLTDQIFSLHVMPMYHGMGVLQLCWTASCGLVVSSFEPKSPTPVPNPDALFVAAKATNSDIIFCVPSFIEAWARRPEYVKWLAMRGGVLYGGGPLNKEAGDYMTSQGVSLHPLRLDRGRNHPHPSSQGRLRLGPLPAPEAGDGGVVPYGNNTFEKTRCPPSVITRVNGVDAYATSDLLMPHPSKPGYWRVFGRTDDQIMHNTGEKTNPGPLENMLNQDPHVLSSVMFGRGRFQAGIIVDPKPDFKFDPADEVKLAEFRNKIWPTVERMNAYAPQHSRLFKEVRPTYFSSHSELTPRHASSSRSRRSHSHHGQEHRATAGCDRRLRGRGQPGIRPGRGEHTVKHPAAAHWDLVATTDFVRAVVNKVLVHAVQDDDDIFEHGCDRHMDPQLVLRALHDSAQLDTRKSSATSSTRPSIARLAGFLATLAAGTEGDVDTSHKARADAMRAMAAKFSADFPAIRAGTPRAIRLDLTKESFDLPDTIYQEMHRRVTHIIHNAWRVDFNLALTSFESTSIGVFQTVEGREAQPEDAIEPEIAVGTGYTESKWVSEHILHQAKAKSSLRPVVVRVGQVCGGQDGAWNLNEWFPSLVQSVEKLRFSLTMTGASEKDPICAPASRVALATVVSSEFAVPLVPYADWLAKLDQVARPISRNGQQEEVQAEVELARRVRALRLLPFFKALAKADGGTPWGSLTCPYRGLWKRRLYWRTSRSASSGLLT
ncbi:hypothetical protein A0H81_05885 [Grifola frondosa]|uniref:Acetyl-CoA synthetase-like protein n=1 Tax=Grifola frondosa TaxID=5627 RepID=A0A1C7M9F9_GRIFR|nr:hypothetical protein A0H81_05885 [Grifola frondosa]